MIIPKWPCHLHIPQAREGPHVDRKALSTVRCHNNHKIQFRTNLKAGKQHDTSARSFVYHSTWLNVHIFWKYEILITLLISIYFP